MLGQPLLAFTCAYPPAARLPTYLVVQHSNLRFGFVLLLDRFPLGVLAPCLTACFRFAITRCLLHRKTQTEVEVLSLRQGSVVPIIISTMTSSRIHYPRVVPIFGAYLTSSLPRWFIPRRGKVSIVAQSYIYIPSSITPSSYLGSNDSVHPPKIAPSSPFMDSAEPTLHRALHMTARLTFTRLSRVHCVTGCCLRATHCLGRGPRLSGVLPCVGHPSHVRHSYQATNQLLGRLSPASD